MTGVAATRAARKSVAIGPRAGEHGRRALPRIAGMALVGFGAPKLCCLVPLLVKAYPAVVASVTTFGAAAALENLDARCAASLPAWLDFPLLWCLALLAAGLSLLVPRRWSRDTR